MRTKRTLVATLVVLGIAAAVGFASSLSKWDTNVQQNDTEKATNVDLIFADGFESGDTSAWDDLNMGACTISSVTLPVPARRK